MGSIDFEKLITEGVARDAVPEGKYLFKVIDARSNDSGKGNGTVFLDLEVQEGPLKGSMTQVSVFIPDGSSQNPRGAAFHFANKIAGFKLGPEVGRAMNGGRPAPILAEALVDQVFLGEVDVQGDGQYAGSNNLVSTKPVNDAEAVATAETQATSATVTEPEDEDLPF